METTELAARALRAYERGRFSRALRVAPFVVAAAGVAIACGRPLAMTCALGCALLPLAVWLLVRGGNVGRAVAPGLGAGWAALSLPLLLRTAGHACFGSACMSLCLPVCALGGVLSGALIGVLARRDGGGLGYVVAAAAIAGLSGAMGCSLGGSFGILGMAAGVVAGGAPILLAARH
jgi:hypothetical protein